MATVEVDNAGNATVKTVGQRIKAAVERGRMKTVFDTQEKRDLVKRILRRSMAEYPAHDDGDEGRGLDGSKGVL